MLMQLLCLFPYSFSYSQNTGLGENPSIPIGYGQRIYSPYLEWTVFYPDQNKDELNKDELQIENFIVKDNILFTPGRRNTECRRIYDTSTLQPMV